MLTVTTTGRINQLRDRALQAETALAATNLQLEDVREELRTSDLELQSVRADLKTAQADSGQSLVAKAKASEAVTRLLLKDASERLADQSRTITELRAELEQARAGQPADPGLPEDTVLSFRTVGGGLVVATGREGRLGSPFAWTCLTCGADSGVQWYADLRDVRPDANEHAGECRAIPATSGATTTAAGKAGARS